MLSRLHPFSFIFDELRESTGRYSFFLFFLGVGGVVLEVDKLTSYMLS